MASTCGWRGVGLTKEQERLVRVIVWIIVVILTMTVPSLRQM